jgi:hypothetical protein
MFRQVNKRSKDVFIGLFFVKVAECGNKKNDRGQKRGGLFPFLVKASPDNRV